MPMPKPKDKETKKEFLDRCMGDDLMNKEYPDEKQRYAACNSLWDKEDNSMSTEKKEKNSMGNEIERRAFSFTEVRIEGDEDKPKITGFAAVFDQLSVPLWGFREKVAKGAFARTIKKEDIKALWNHEPSFILGRNKNKTLVLEEVDKGLDVGILPPDTQWGRDATELIRRGDVDQMSFSFEVVKDMWESQDTKNPIRTLLEVKLFDVSPVTFPAYPQTTVKARSMLPGTGLNLEAISGLFVRVERGLSLTQTDIDLINSSIEILRSYIPADAEPVSPPADEGEQAIPERLARLRRQLDVAELS